ncbi:uncharacterized protein E5676_scaffold469G00030 [Cucumis melo var. makuwa]|uniref:Uncharacterized protein n=1 Tax=Cucumis melo var. makuwa TaxID=1194695 RepID=A0A5D3BCQ4_CUCMM|nr:uncharacterized protein E5676_scaffold469G00030 [Cucumis melo var. makuwa]
MATEAQPSLTDQEMTSMFMNTLRAPFYDRMIGNASTNVSDIIVIGERIEYDIKHERLADAIIEYGGIKKGTVSKKKEGEGQCSKTNSDTQRFDLIPMTYIELLPQLIQNRQLAPIRMIPIQPPYPKWYDSNARCD